jgi:6-phospho-beta-glucosidase
MKITVIGGGSTYSPELVNGFLNKVSSFPVKELWLMDIDPQRLEIVGGFTQRMAAKRGSPFRVELTTNLSQAVRNSRYVITQLRVGMNPARREDEYLGRRHGLVGQETTGVGGMAKALRTIPVILEIARAMQELAPGALLANFTNPAGLVTEALRRYAPAVPSVGVCNVGITTKMHMLESLTDVLGPQATGEKIEPQRAQLNTLGLNHLTWHRGFTLDGQEMWPVIFGKYLENLRSQDDPEWDTATVETLGMIPNYYLHYFYYTPDVITAQQKWPPSRAEQVMEIEKDLLRQYADPSLTELPTDLMKRGGAYYSTLATELLNSMHNNLGQVHVVNVPNRGAVPEYPADWVLEMPCRVDAGGIHPLPAKPLPAACFGLVAAVKMYELLTVEAALHGDRKALYEALLAHPLGPKARQVQAVLDDLLQTNRQFLPQFA